MEKTDIKKIIVEDHSCTYSEDNSEHESTDTCSILKI